jgi:hypothetical protein
MTALRRSIIATIGFAGASAWPLTLMDIHERLVPCSRFGGKTISRPTIAEILQRLDALKAEGVISSALGMYALGDVDPHIFSARVDREKHCVQKWRRMRRAAWWLQAVPYVEALIASGSLALGNTGPESDWDVFVIARTGRLYTARTGLLFIAAAMGRLRTKHDSVASDKFCFNQYVTTEHLTIQHRSIYGAHALAMLTPVYDPRGWLERFRRANQWTLDWIPLTAGQHAIHRPVRHSWLLGQIRRMLEWLLDSRGGDWVERRLAGWQRRRIMREPATHEPGGRVIADERMMEFHPHSAEVAVMSAYNLMLQRHGMGAYAEQDSGLTR